MKEMDESIWNAISEINDKMRGIELFLKNVKDKFEFLESNAEDLKHINHSPEDLCWHSLEYYHPQEDEICFVCWWLYPTLCYSEPIRAYWDKDCESFIPLDCHFAFPLKVDIWMSRPDLPKEQL